MCNKLDLHLKKKKSSNLDPLPHTIQEINFNYIGDQKVKLIKLLEIIIRAYFHYLGEHKAFLKVTENNNYSRKIWILLKVRTHVY